MMDSVAVRYIYKLPLRGPLLSRYHFCEPDVKLDEQQSAVTAALAVTFRLAPAVEEVIPGPRTRVR